MTMQDVRLQHRRDRKPELDAKLVAEGISQQLEKRVMFRRAMKRAVTNTMRSGALGIKVRISGPFERVGNRAHGDQSRGPRAAAHVPATSTTVSPRRRPRTA